MPEYLAPGVYVEEVSFRSKSIEGVSTTTTAFVGPTRYGPTDITPDVITSVTEYERTYGDRLPLEFDKGERPNYVAMAVQAFFSNGGKRLYIARTFHPNADRALSGYATTTLSGTLNARARFPGAGGNMRVRLTLTAGPNVLAGLDADPIVHGLAENDLVIVDSGTGSPPLSPLDAAFALAQPTVIGGVRSWRFNHGSGQI